MKTIEETVKIHIDKSVWNSVKDSVIDSMRNKVKELSE